MQKDEINIASWLVKSQHFNLAWIFAEVKSLGCNKGFQLQLDLKISEHEVAAKQQCRRAWVPLKETKPFVICPSLNFPKQKHVNFHVFHCHCPEKCQVTHKLHQIWFWPCMHSHHPGTLPWLSANQTALGRISESNGSLIRILRNNFEASCAWTRGTRTHTHTHTHRHTLPLRGASWVHGSKSQSAQLNALVLPSPYNRRAALVSCSLQWSLRKCHDEDYAHIEHIDKVHISHLCLSPLYIYSISVYHACDIF